MEYINLDREWEFRRGFVDSLGGLGADMKVVNLPHDGMISTPTDKNAPAKYDSGYFNGDMVNYTKYVEIPSEWEKDRVGLHFDGVMMHTTIEVNGSKVGEHHYGYTPFYVDITDFVTLGQKNRITINANTGIQPSSRWYTGSGLFRGVTLCHSPQVYIIPDGIYVYTTEVSDGVAYMKASVDVCNSTSENRLAEVSLTICEEKTGREVKRISRTIQINKCVCETAEFSWALPNPLIWDADSPNLYVAKASVTDAGIYRTHFVRNEACTVDEASTLFGIRTISVDALRGLRINGKTVKLKGGCLHHDNGLLGAVSLYESEARKVRKLKEVGFNAIRTAHNPPSAALVEACDREGMYIFDEAYDAWGMAKRPGDFSNYFNERWEEELTAFVKRDRVHPAVIMWSTGNEIPERGGLSNGYTLATRLAMKIKSLDSSRPVSNGICSFWSGLDDYMAQGQNSAQNAANGEDLSWDTLTEAFTNGLDVVGYNYMEDLYEDSHKRFPDRVILGSENFPREIGFRWPLVESLPYVIGEFTWTAWDYIGEAGIGKAIFLEPDDPKINEGDWTIMPPTTSPYPWRLANDADIDINGKLRPQGAYRSIVWGSNKTHLYVNRPEHYGKVERTSMWGFTDVEKSWNYKGYENKPIEVVVFTNADEVELYVNGENQGRRAVSKERPLPGSVRFNTTYVPGIVEAVSFKDGKEVSRDRIETTGEVVGLVLEPERRTARADGHDVVYINMALTDEKGRVVNDCDIELTATIEGAGMLAGFGTGNPVTDEIYTDERTVTYKGEAMAVIRSGYESGKITVKVTAETGLSAECEISVE